MLRSIGYKDEIHSFEPIKVHFDVLAETSASDKNWFIYQYALGAEVGSDEIHVHSGLSSFLEPSEYGVEFAHGELKRRRKETVEISTLDHFLSHELTDVQRRNVFLKMDTQGFDLEVFKGGTGTIHFVAALQSEIALKKLYEAMPDFTKSFETYLAQGFEVTGFYPVSREKRGTIIEVDCVMIRGD
ncbi:MAG TPA: FkbM family methyltransferase [Gammaproteobacteria bacterium]|nr:FkbM family methyltransferase [Gammaproteobacteria bacterium]HIL98071.1 FkbM family methyltransferase [Pseudomonadales bacterium]